MPGKNQRHRKSPRLFLPRPPASRLITRIVAGSISKLLFPRSSRGQRRRKVRAFWLWLVIGILIVAVVVGLLCLLWYQAQRTVGSSLGLPPWSCG